MLTYSCVWESRHPIPRWDVTKRGAGSNLFGKQQTAQLDGHFVFTKPFIYGLETLHSIHENQCFPVSRTTRSKDATGGSWPYY